jgi:hypothetical protein
VRQETVNLTSIVQKDVGTEEDKEDDEGVGDERDIWEVSHVTEEDFESTDGGELDSCLPRIKSSHAFAP